MLSLKRDLVWFWIYNNLGPFRVTTDDRQRDYFEGDRRWWWLHAGSIFVSMLAASSLAIVLAVAAVFLSAWLETLATIDTLMTLLCLGLFGLKVGGYGKYIGDLATNNYRHEYCLSRTSDRALWTVTMASAIVWSLTAIVDIVRIRNTRHDK